MKNQSEFAQIFADYNLQQNCKHLVVMVGFTFLGAGLYIGLLNVNSSHSLPESCTLSSDAVTVEAVSRNYQQCKTVLKLDFSISDRRFNAVAAQLDPNLQLTDNTKNAFEAIFEDVEEQFKNQRPWYVKFSINVLVILSILRVICALIMFVILFTDWAMKLSMYI